MFNPWGTANPADIFSMWSNALAPNTPPASPVYTQMSQFGNAFREIYDSMQSQSQGTFNQMHLEELVKLFAINPIIPAFPPSASFIQNSPWNNLFDIGKTSTGFRLPNTQPPALGIGREFQEDWTKLLKLQQEYDSALRAFMEIFQDFIRNASESFMNSLSGFDEQTGFDDMCRMWIDCCENEFQKTAVTPEYSSAYGQLINAYIRLIQQSNQVQEKFSKMMGQPTRSELNDLHQKNLQTSCEIEKLNQTIRDLEQKIIQTQDRKPTRKPRKTSTSSKSRTRTSKN